jgi:hypothetical protein
MAGFCKSGKRVFKITGGVSSFTAYITEAGSFLKEFLARFPCEKLAGSGRGLEGKGR